MTRESKKMNPGSAQVALSPKRRRIAQVSNYDHMDDIDGPEIDLLSLLRGMLRYRKLVVLIFMIFFSTALALTVMKRPMYTAAASLELNTQGRNAIKLNSVQKENLGSYQYLTTQLKILESRSVARKVVEELNLATHPEFNGKLTQRSILGGLRSIFKVFSSNPETAKNSNVELAIAIYSGRLRVSSIASSSLVKIEFNSFDPELAAKLADEHINAYIRLSSARRLDSSSEAKGFIEREIQSVKLRLSDSEIKLTQFARDNGVVDVEDTNNIMMSRLTAINEALSDVQNQRIDAETKYLQSRSASQETLAHAYGDDLIKSLQQEKAASRTEYLELSRTYKPKYPVMKQLEAKINEIDAALRLQVGQVVVNLKSSYEQLVLREKGLKAEVDTLKSQLLDLQDRAVTYNILKREWESNKTLYSNLLERTKEVGVASGMELNVGTLVDSAGVPGSSSSPRYRFDLLMGALLGLGAGLGCAFFLVLLDNKVNDVDSLENITNIPNLVVLPEIDIDIDEKKGVKDRGSHDLRLLSNPNDIFSESIQQLRANLSYSVAKGMPRSIAVTSSMPEEGKSTISVNLAISYARSGAKVLLIEADLRKPRLAKVFNVKSKKGLAHSLETGAELMSVKVKEVPGLNVVVAGTRVTNPIDLLGSQSMDKLIQKCQEQYDIVIVDCPPVGGLADTTVVSTLVESVLFVVCAHMTPKNVVENSLNRLNVVGAPIVGTVFNRADPVISGYNYYAYGYHENDDATQELPPVDTAA